MRRALTLMLSIAGLTATPHTAALAQPEPIQMIGTSTSSVVGLPEIVHATPRSDVAIAKANDSAELAEKVAIIRQSAAFMALFNGAPSEAVVQQYIEYFATTVTLTQARQFVRLTAGRHFVVTGSVEAVNVSLVDGPSLSPRRVGYKCWKAWVASYAWFAATGAMCGAVTALPGPGGVACSLAFWGLSSLPDFDKACK